MDGFDYHLPASAVAQEPVTPRSAARLLVATDRSGAVQHLRVADLAALVGPGDLIVVNDTEVLPARLHLRRPTGGAVEVLMLEPSDDVSHRWTALVRRGRRVAPGTRLLAGDEPVLEVGGHLDGGRRMVRLLRADVMEEVGSVPLPPYIRRSVDDPGRYQTVFARHPGSVAAPTAGLHFTHELIGSCRAAGAEVMALDLAVGLATFQPVTAERPEDHRMHEERYNVPPEVMSACERAERVLAVGTTTVRALEAAASSGRLRGRTSLFIRGHFRFRVVDLLLTNFHMPRSSLLLLLDAFCGPRWRDLYSVALAEGYRFLSFGDAMLVARRPSP